MVDKKHKAEVPPDDIEITTDTSEIPNDTDLTDTEAKATEKVKQLQGKLKAAEAERVAAVEELHRTKADYLNARKHLEEQSTRAQARQRHAFIEQLLPLCDSFQVAMQNESVWNQVDETWRKGVEGIHAQLQAILQQNQIVTEDPCGKEFDPQRHEALSEVNVTDASQHNIVQSVIQLGYVTDDDTQTVIRPARVVVGNFVDIDEK